MRERHGQGETKSMYRGRVSTIEQEYCLLFQHLSLDEHAAANSRRLTLLTETLT